VILGLVLSAPFVVEYYGPSTPSFPVVRVKPWRVNSAFTFTALVWSPVEKVTSLAFIHVEFLSLMSKTVSRSKSPSKSTDLQSPQKRMSHKVPQTLADCKDPQIRPTSQRSQDPANTKAPQFECKDPKPPKLELLTKLQTSPTAKTPKTISTSKSPSWRKDTKFPRFQTVQRSQYYDADKVPKVRVSTKLPNQPLRLFLADKGQHLHLCRWVFSPFSPVVLTTA
jgi:hypothetical protein